MLHVCKFCMCTVALLFNLTKHSVLQSICSRTSAGGTLHLVQCNTLHPAKLGTEPNEKAQSYMYVGPAGECCFCSINLKCINVCIRTWLNVLKTGLLVVVPVVLCILLTK